MNKHKLQTRALMAIDWCLPTPAYNLQEKEPRLPTLLKLLVWAQNQLDTRCTYPRINDLAAPTLTDPMQTL